MLILLGLITTCFSYDCLYQNSLSICVLQNVIITNDSVFEINSKSKIYSTLSISQSEVKCIPTRVFQELPKLKELILKNTGLQSSNLPGGFKEGGNLEKFTSERNNMTRIFDDSFKGAEKLDQLSLINSRIESISEYAFAGLEVLRKLKISFNNLTEISALVLKPLGSLESLDLSFNQITQLEGGSFKYNDKLIEINLSGNLINIVDPNVFCDTKQLRALIFRENLCEDESFYGLDVLQLQMSKCFNNFFLMSSSFLKSKKSRVEYQKCFLDHFDEHAMAVYQHIYNEFHKGDDAYLKHFEEVQGWLILAVIGIACEIIVVVVSVVIFIKMKLNRKDQKAKTSDMEELITS